MARILGFIFKSVQRTIIFLVLIIVLITTIWIFIDDDEDDEIIDLESKFPLSDYLYKNSSQQKPIKEENRFGDVQNQLKEALNKIKDLENKKSKVVVLSPAEQKQKDAEQKQKDEALKEIVDKYKKTNKGLTLDEDGNLVDENGNIIKSKKELEAEAKRLQEEKERIKRATDPSYRNKEFDPKNKTVEQKRRIRLLAERFGGSNLAHEDKEREIEYGVDEFSNLDKQDTGSNEHKLLRTITADKLIPAILIRPISSQLSGEVIAQVETNIYGAMGRAVLIPKGSKIIGNYGNSNRVGEYRLQVLWTRIITPQGINILLTNAKGADVKGYSGLIGELHKRNWERYGLPLSLSTLSNALLIGVSSALNSSDTNAYNAYSTSQILSQSKTDVSNVINQIIREQIKINPIIVIREGSRIFISLTRDIFIPTPKKGETLARFFKEDKKEDEETQTQDTDIYFE